MSRIIFLDDIPEPISHRCRRIYYDGVDGRHGPYPEKVKLANEIVATWKIKTKSGEKGQRKYTWHLNEFIWCFAFEFSSKDYYVFYLIHHKFEEERGAIVCAPRNVTFKDFSDTSFEEICSFFVLAGDDEAVDCMLELESVE
jgi:hypothetical protein